MKKNIDPVSSFSEHKKKSKTELLKEIEKLESEILSLRSEGKTIKGSEKNVHNRRIEDQEQYKSFLDNLPVGIFRSTTDGKFISSNKRLRDMFGFSSVEELMSYPISNLYINQTKRDELINILKENGESHGKEVQLRRKDRSTFIASITERFVTDKDGKFLYFEGIIEDITERKNIEKEIKKLATLVEQAAVSIVLTDLNGNIEYVNPWFKELTGYKLEEVKGKNPRILKSSNAEYPEMYFKHMWKTIIQGNMWKGQFLNRKKNGEDYIEDATIFPVKTANGELLGFGAVKKDISWNIRMEKELEASYTEMESLKNKAESASKLKTIFLANMSHDIRTPLNAILGFANLLAKLASDSKQQEYTEKIIRSGNILLNLINDILDLSKIEAGQLSIAMETYFLKELLDYISTIFMHQFEKKGLEFSITSGKEVPEKIFGDLFRTQQVIINILSNSLKYTFSGKVSLEIKYESSSDKIKFYVTDSGVGIPDEIQDKIFSPFFSKRSSKKIDEASTGLGLSICKNLTHMMGGEISVSSRKGEGSIFIVELPVNSASVEDILILKDNIARLEISTSEIREKRILIADDNPVNVELVKEQLINRGFSKFASASNGNEAIETTQEFNPHLILMDNKMPVKDGIEATKDLRDKGFKRPIIILSADVIEEKREKSLRSGADEYLTKPINFDILFLKMNKLLNITSDNDEQNYKNNLKKENSKGNKYKIDESVSEKTKKLFINDLENKLEIIEGILGKKDTGFDLENTAFIAHTYMGNAGYFGLKHLESVSSKLDRGFKDNISESNIIRLTEEMADIIKTIIKNNKTG